MWAIRLWLVLAFGVGLLVELGTRYGVPLVNANMRRFQVELNGAVKLRQEPSRSRISILAFGNSLTLAGLDLKSLEQQMGPRVQVQRWAIDDTNYLDWLFGLRHVYELGGQPNIVLIGGKGVHFLAPHVRGNFFSHYILRYVDLFDAAARINGDVSTKCSMMLAQLSAFYGSREEVYKRLITWVLPDFPKLAKSFRSAANNRVNTVPDCLARAEMRLTELNTLCETHDSKLLIWLPPTPYIDRNANVITEAARRCGVPAFTPIADGALAQSYFEDGYHLNSKGAKITTLALASMLKPFVATTANAASPGSLEQTNVAGTFRGQTTMPNDGHAGLEVLESTTILGNCLSR